MSKCHVCGAISFRKVIERDPGGAMSHLGRFACGMVFTDRQVWSGAAPAAAPGLESQTAQDRSSALELD